MKNIYPVPVQYRVCSYVSVRSWLLFGFRRGELVVLYLLLSHAAHAPRLYSNLLLLQHLTQHLRQQDGLLEN